MGCCDLTFTLSILYGISEGKIFSSCLFNNFLAMLEVVLFLVALEIIDLSVELKVIFHQFCIFVY